jgi:CRP-like cAMP-binding protein
MTQGSKHLTAKEKLYWQALEGKDVLIVQEGRVSSVTGTGIWVRYTDPDGVDTAVLLNPDSVCEDISDDGEEF